MLPKNDISILDRFIAALSYLTLGGIGLIWIIINAIFIKRLFYGYLAANIVQSFVISIIFAIFGYIYQIFAGILIRLPFVGDFFLKIHAFFVMTPVFNTMSLINYIIFVFLCYLAIVSLFGKVPFVPFVSDITKRLYR